jgi:hypothetical protein
MSEVDREAEALANIRKLIPRPFQPEPLPPIEPRPKEPPFAEA